MGCLACIVYDAMLGGKGSAVLGHYGAREKPEAGAAK